MAPDLEQGGDSRREPREGDRDRQKARRRVEWYFGDVLDDVSAAHPVARHRLVATLADLDTVAREHEALLAEHAETVEGAEAPGRVVELPLHLWSLFEEESGFSETEGCAARAVHRRMGEALVSSDASARAPLFVVACERPHSS